MLIKEFRIGVREFPILTIVAGATNTGKTSLIRKLVDNRNRVLTVTPHLNEWTDVSDVFPDNRNFWKFNGIRRAIAYPDILKDINRNGNEFKNGVLILEEVRFYVNSNVEKAVIQMLISRDQRKMDIIVSAHGITEIPPIFFTYADVFILFATQDNLLKRKKDLIWYNQISELQQKVNKKAELDYHYYDIFKTKELK